MKASNLEHYIPEAYRKHVAIVPVGDPVRYHVRWTRVPDAWKPTQSYSSTFKKLMAAGVVGYHTTQFPDKLGADVAAACAKVDAGQLGKPASIPPNGLNVEPDAIRSHVVASIERARQNGLGRKDSGVQPLGALTDQELRIEPSVVQAGEAHRAVLQLTVTRLFASSSEAHAWCYRLAAELAERMQEKEEQAAMGG